MKDLSRYVGLCRKELDALRIPYDRNAAFRVNTRSVRRWGACVRRPDGRHEISIAERLLQDDVPDRALMEIIHHELLHTVPQAKGHGALWKSYAARVNEAYGYAIKRTKTAAELGVPTETAAGSPGARPRRRPSADRPPKHLLVCGRCGTEFPRWKETPVTRNPGRYRCRCGGKLKKLY